MLWNTQKRVHTPGMSNTTELAALSVRGMWRLRNGTSQAASTPAAVAYVRRIIRTNLRTLRTAKDER